MDNVGSAVISNTHICEVSKLIYKEDFEKDLNEVRYNTTAEHFSKWTSRYDMLHDLIHCIESIILNDTLFTLPATGIDPTNMLWTRLMQEGILQVLDTGGFSAAIGQRIITEITNANPSKHKETKVVRARLNKFFLEKDSPDANYFWYTFMSGKYRDSYWFNGDRRNLTELSISVIETLNIRGSGRYDSCTSVLRDMYYIFAAEQLKMPYYPQSVRAEFAENFPNYFDLIIKSKIYGRISEALEATIAEVYEDVVGRIIPVPPVAAIVLSRSSTRKDIIENTLEIRDQLASTRKNFNKLELKRRESTSLKERTEIHKLQKKLFDDASALYNKKSAINFRTVVKYIPEVIKPATDVLSPTSYSADLLLKPFDYLINWWKQRPYSKMYSISKDVYQIHDYPHLLSKFYPAQEGDRLW
jgi:hypothetical protein